MQVAVGVEGVGVVSQQGLVGKVGVKSTPNLARELLLQSRHVPGLAGGGTYEMPTVSRMALITPRGSFALTFDKEADRHRSKTKSLMSAANSDPDCCKSRGRVRDYMEQQDNRMEKVHRGTQRKCPQC